MAKEKTRKPTADTPRGKPLRVPVNDDERKAIDAAAASEGLASATWARRVLLIEARKARLAIAADPPVRSRR